MTELPNLRLEKAASRFSALTVKRRIRPRYGGYSWQTDPASKPTRKS